jgi:hypothetical protein
VEADRHGRLLTPRAFRVGSKERQIDNYRIVAFRSAKAASFAPAKGDNYFHAGSKRDPILIAGIRPVKPLLAKEGWMGSVLKNILLRQRFLA